MRIGAGAALLLGEEGVEGALPARVGTREDGRQGGLSGGHRGLLDEEERPHDLCSGSQIYQALCVNGGELGPAQWRTVGVLVRVPSGPASCTKPRILVLTLVLAM